ncbi:MAG: hypothetical protein AAF708_15760, partial [Deinococcota bacterium]
MTISNSALESLQHAIAQDSSSQSKLLQSLSRALLTNNVPEVLSQLDTGQLKAFSEHALAFLTRRGDAPLLLEVFTPSLEQHGWQLPYSVVMVALA